MQRPCRTDVSRLFVKRIFTMEKGGKYLVKFQSFCQIECCHGKPFFKRRCITVNMMIIFSHVLQNLTDG